MHYARRGIITPEMDYVAIRENLGRAILKDKLLRDGRTGARPFPIS
jgi:phosphomethylpyrimidine synthase